MAWLRKRGDKYYIGFRENGKDRYEATGLVDEAQAEIARKKKELELDLSQGVVRPQMKSLRFSEIMAFYQKEVDLSQSTLRLNNYSWINWIEFSNDLPVDKITTGLIIEFRDKMKLTYSPTTISIYLRDLNKVLGFAFHKGIIKRNPCKKENSEKWAIEHPTEQDDFHVLTPEEEQTIVAAADPILARMIPFVIETGLRISQVVALDWRQYNPKTHILKIPPQKRQRVRLIPITNEPVVGKTGISAMKAMGPVRLEGSVFGADSADQIEKMYARLRKATGFYNKTTEEFLFDFHDLRHTCASRLCEILNPVEVRDFFGWSSVAMVDRYTHSNVKGIQEKLKRHSLLAV